MITNIWYSQSDNYQRITLQSAMNTNGWSSDNYQRSMQ